MLSVSSIDAAAIDADAVVPAVGSIGSYCCWINWFWLSESPPDKLLSLDLSLLLVVDKLLALDRRPSEPLGILPQLPISLGGKTIVVNVIEAPLDFHRLIIIMYML
jgi:hypothetical protein